MVWCQNVLWSLIQIILSSSLCRKGTIFRTIIFCTSLKIEITGQKQKNSRQFACCQSSRFAQLFIITFWMSHKHQSLTESNRRAESVWVVVYINPRHSLPLQSGYERFVLNMDTTTLWTVRSCSKVSGSDNVFL